MNKVILIGNLGDDAELKEAGGSTVATFRIATSKRWKNKAGEQQEKTEWHSINCWGKLGEICGLYLKKGMQVYIEGELENYSFVDKEGVTKYGYNINGKEMKMLGAKGDSSAAPQEEVFDANNPPF